MLMALNLLFFGNLSEITGCRNMTIENTSNVKGLKDHLHRLYPDLQKRNYMIAVNQNMAGNEQSLQDHDEVALLPPFSGG